MSVNLRPTVIAAREKLKKRREKLKKLHDGGAPGIQVCTYLTDMVDAVVLDLYQAAINEIDPELTGQIALAPHGGYGRRDVAPYSDVDLMLLFDPAAESAVQPLARRLQQDICDAGLDLGLSLRTPKEAWALSLKDPIIFYLSDEGEETVIESDQDLRAA